MFATKYTKNGNFDKSHQQSNHNNLVYRIEQNIHECVFIDPSSDTFSNPFFFSQQCTAPCNYSTLQAHQPENAILNVMYNKTKK